MDFAKTALSILTVFVVTIAIPAVWRYLVVRYRLRTLQGPRGLPVLGNALQLGTDNQTFFKTMTKWAEEYREHGCFVLYVCLRPIVVITNAQHAETILCNTKLDRKAYFYYLLKPWIGDGLLMSGGSKWSFRRKLLTPSFHFSILEKFLEAVNEQARILTHNLCGMIDRPHVKITHPVTLCSLDTICETMMGFELGAQKGEGGEYLKALHRMGEIFAIRLRSPLYWNDTLFRQFPLGKEQTECLKYLHQMTQKVIRYRKENLLKDAKNAIIDDKSQEVRKRRRLALLDLLIEAQRQNNSFTDEDIQEEVDNFMFAGHDTVASAVSFALYCIGRHPRVQRKVQAELDQVFGNDRDRPLTTDDIQKLEYLSCVVKESLRVMPPAPLQGREIEEDVNVCGCTVPKGATVFLAIFWLHRDPKQFPDPEKFDPDRFLPEKVKERHKFAFLPFSAGHRNCIGQKFALMEEKVILATVLRKLNITSPQSIDELGLKFELVLRASESIKVKLSLR